MNLPEEAGRFYEAGVTRRHQFETGCYDCRSTQGALERPSLGQRLLLWFGWTRKPAPPGEAQQTLQ